MAPRGWHARYSEILSEFGYSRSMDLKSALALDSIIGDPVPHDTMRELLAGRAVFVIGAGPSLSRSIPVIQGYTNPKIAADSALRVLLENGIKPDLVVTDLDGDEESLVRAAREGCIMIVHAHGDNAGRLGIAGGFPRCAGTTQGRTVGRISNFGGFTDGDRAVFMASALGARRIILFGMDLGTRIGRLSGTRASERNVKLRKLAKARELLEWLARTDECELYATSGRIAGFKRIGPGDLKDVASI